jgi:hypothetical protein
LELDKRHERLVSLCVDAKYTLEVSRAQIEIDCVLDGLDAPGGQGHHLANQLGKALDVLSRALNRLFRLVRNQQGAASHAQLMHAGIGWCAPKCCLLCGCSL